MSKQDRQGVRRPAELERKYNIGGFISEQRRNSLRQESEMNDMEARQSQLRLTTEEKIELLKEQYRATEQSFGEFKENTETSLNGLGKELNSFQKLLAEYWKTIYPVGSIYMSVNATSPQTLFGGTWEQVKDRFLLGAGSTYTAGSTGGEANVTLTEDQMPQHTHKLALTSTAGEGSYSTSYVAYTKTGGNTYTNANAVSSAGGGGSHNNMPPYLTVYVWKRTA